MRQRVTNGKRVCWCNVNFHHPIGGLCAVLPSVAAPMRYVVCHMQRAPSQVESACVSAPLPAPRQRYARPQGHLPLPLLHGRYRYASSPSPLLIAASASTFVPHSQIMLR